jgi:hypothetical protein
MLAGLCALASVGSVFAQGLNIRSAEFSLSIGDSQFQNKNFTIGQPQTAPNSPIKGTMDLSSGKMYEARINFYTQRHLGAEFLYGYQYGGVVFTTNAPSRFGVPLQVHTIGINGLYYLTNAKAAWRPFVTIGGGAVIYRPSSGGQAAAKDPLQGNFDTFFETTRGYGMVGAGVKRPITKSIGFRADVGELFSKVPTFGLPESSASTNATVLPVGGIVRSFRASAGVVFYLGK